MAWIESHQGLAKHPKTLKLARKLNISIAQVIGHLHLFWWWAMEYAQDGDLSHCDPEDIAIAADWPGDAGQFVESLVESGFVDRHNDGSLSIHDWHDYAGKLLERRKADAERKKKEREKKGIQKISDGHPTDVQRTSNVTLTNNLNLNPKNNKSIADSGEIGETFERFWAAYPKKQGKQAAWKKWQTLYKQGKIDIDFILERLQQYIAYVESERRRGFDRQFMDGSTFVNQERWNDDWNVQPQARAPTDHMVQLQQRMRDRNELPLEWVMAE